MTALVEELTGYLTPTEAAARLGISEAWLRQWAMKGLVSYLATPRSRLYPEAEIERIARERAQRGDGA